MAYNDLYGSTSHGALSYGEPIIVVGGNSTYQRAYSPTLSGATVPTSQKLDFTPYSLAQYKKSLHREADDTLSENQWLQREGARIKAQNDTIRSVYVNFLGRHETNLLKSLQFAEQTAANAKLYSPKAAILPVRQEAKPKYLDGPQFVAAVQPYSPASSQSQQRANWKHETRTPSPSNSESSYSDELPPAEQITMPHRNTYDEASRLTQSYSPHQSENEAMRPTGEHPLAPPGYRKPYIPTGRPAPADGFYVGTIIIWIHGARKLPNLDMGFLDKTDAYVRISIDGKKGHHTRTINDNLDPQWEEMFICHYSGYFQSLVFTANDDDLLSKKERIGTVTFDLNQVLKGCKRQWFPLQSDIVRKKGNGELCLSVESHVHDEVGQTPEVPFSGARMKKGNMVKLYQDAHCSNHLPAVPCFNNKLKYKNNDCWNDLYQAFHEAQRFIYITGWSVWTKLILKRDGNPCETLGDLLKKKADEGVTVLIAPWDDATSRDSKILNTLFKVTAGGLMNTNDEETRKFFQGTKVVVRLMPRLTEGTVKGGGKVSTTSFAMGAAGGGVLYTHHQKSIILDAPSRQGKLKIVAFIGGLDITNGRFDTPDHTVFEDIDKNFIKYGDFYQGYVGVNDVGPREPWHDIHSRVEGPAARDIMHNFEQRWRCQAKDASNLLINLNTGREFLSEAEEEILDPESWNVQFFRSIDKMSANVDQLVEHSIQDAYVHNIRRAQRFIYIENQYFLGSAHEWDHSEVEAPNVIPIELANRCIAKMRKGERFCVYVVIPLHPEGVPEAGATQGILFWQYQTIRMMYRKLAEGIRKYNAQGQPTDYLKFFFLGTREPNARINTSKTVDNARQRKLIERRGQMIYVHSKMMIVDDEYIIVGSANINERSMSGYRDTEMAIGAYQPRYTQGSHQDVPAHGQVCGFRLSLWAEHMGQFAPEFLYPESLDCSQKVAAFAEANYSAYTNPTPTALPHGHIISYPYTISAAGDVQPRSMYLPDLEDQKALTTGAKPSEAMFLLTT